MGQEERVSWLGKREDEYVEKMEKQTELEDALARSGKEMKANKDERECWQKYIVWIEKNRDKMEDPNATILVCKTMQKELAEKYNELIEELKGNRSELETIKTLRTFVERVKSGGGRKILKGR